MHSSLLQPYIRELKTLSCQRPILDLACGSGRNGLFCLKNKLATTFADIKEQPLLDIEQTINNDKQMLDSTLAFFWQVDFEQTAFNHLTENSFGAIMVFRYLHRPLIDKIKAAVIPNGLVIYETFTEQQAEFGRPKNPDFLLKKGELASYFSGWEILHSFEGLKTSDTGENQQAVAQIIARKP
ncbi:MAG: SAM-dependent methyltransferase [Colwellia sp.]|nr:SAM-dependent methyltransferase [Colwellia sp.]